MEPLYRTSTTLTWREYKKFHKTDNTYMRIIFFILLFYQIYALLSGDLISIQFILIVLSTILTLVIYFILPVFLLKQEYTATKILHDMPLEYNFYHGFFTVISPIGTELYYYQQFDGSIETKENLYMRLQDGQYFIFEKRNCSPELLKFLLAPSPKQADKQLVFSVLETTPSLPGQPICNTYLMAESTDVIMRLFKFSFLRKTNTATRIPAFLLTAALIFVYLISSLFSLANALQQKNYIGIIFALVLFLLWVLANTSKKTVPVSLEGNIQINIFFYDTFVSCAFPTHTTGTYYYKTLYKLTEDNNFYKLYLTKDNFIPIVKSNCPHELLELMHTLQKQLAK